MADRDRPVSGSDPSTGETANAAPPAAATIAVLHPDAESVRAAQVRDQPVVIGRDGACHLVLTSAAVSRRHASIRTRDGGFELEDLGSGNGTWLNDERLTGVALIGDGDRIRVADVELTFTVPAAPATSAAQVTPPRGTLGEAAQPTEPLGQVGDSRRTGSLAREVVASDCFSAAALGLAILGSVVGAVLTTALNAGQLGGLAGAVIGPILSTTFTTRRAGERGRVRLAAIGALSALALVITVSGFYLADPVVEKPLVPIANDVSYAIQSGSPEPTPQPTVTTTVTTSPAVRHEGPLTVAGGNTYDIDAPASDPLWAINNHQDPGRLFFEAAILMTDEGLSFAPLGDKPSTYESCSTLTGYGSVASYDLVEGVPVCARTDENRFAIVELVAKGSDSVDLEIKTWEIAP